MPPHSLPTRTKNSSSKPTSLAHNGAPSALGLADPAPCDSEFSNKDLKSVGNYTLGRLIGKGSFGKVYLATHKLTNGSKASRADGALHPLPD